MKRQAFWGIDVSKKSIDIFIEEPGREGVHLVVQNTPSRLRTGISQKMAELELTWQQCVFCMENTGWYGYFLLEYLTANSSSVYVVNPLHLKKSLGLVRGKNDRVDSMRIARFIARNHQDLQAYAKPDELVSVLKLQATHRAQLVKQLQQLSSFINELKGCVDKQVVVMLEKTNKPVIASLKQAIKEIDKQIQQTIRSCSRLSRLFKLICSVPGIGPVLGVALLTATNAFTRLTSPKHLASYVGVAPFDYSSGTSIYRKPRVSHMADKKIKKLLHMAALSVIRAKGELQHYYRRKVQEGKSPMAVINAVRNKIIHRVCAVVRADKNYASPLVHP